MAGASRRINFALPFTIVAALVIALVLLVMLFLVQEFDRTAQRREETVVGQGIMSRIHEVASTVLPQVMWDDAVLHLDNHFDRRWATENIATYLTKTGGFDAVVVLNAQDRPIFASMHGDAVPSHFASASAVRGLVAAVRQAEYRRGPLPATPPSDGVLAPAVQASSVVASEGRYFIVVATLVTPDFGRSRPNGARAPVVLAAMDIDQAFLETLADRFLLRGVHLHGGDPVAERYEAHAAMSDIHGHRIVTLDWIPQRPGRHLLVRVGPLVVTIVALLLLTIIVFYRRSVAVARGLVASEARATHLAFHDVLTGLPNRALFLDRLQHALAQLTRHPGSVVVHCLDLDRFKNVNDTMGHLVGDEVIRAAARRMAELCRASDSFARLSGDEFAIIQVNASPGEAASLAARICDSMVLPFELGTGRVFIGCSIGIARCDTGTSDPIELFRQADLALYRAKGECRGRFCLFETEMDAAIKTRRALEDDLHGALAADQIDLFYQPQVDGRGVMIGVEALARWRHPDKGDISPGLFVPIAEQSGLISSLGLFTLRRAFLDSRRWKGLKVSVNVSANQIRTADFVAAVGALVHELAVDPARFELEITEGVLLVDDPETHAKLRALRALGFALVLDDFGTGYSSLSYLRRYPISKIKIDRSFVTNLGVDPEAEAVVAAIVRLSRALNLAVIAEGVETLTQWHRLRAIGCMDAQGYFFRKALCADAIDELWQTPERPLWADEAPAAKAPAPILTRRPRIIA